MELETRKLHTLFGVEILGLDLSRDLEAEELAALGRAFGTHGVCLIRNVEPLTNERQIALSRALGPLSRVATAIAGGIKPRIPYPEITDVGNIAADGSLLKPDSRLALFHLADRLWHTDYSFVDNRATFSLLSAHQVPPEGGDTEFADMRVAYDALPADLKQRIEGKEAEHWVWTSRLAMGYPEPTAEERASRPPARHALIHTHPTSGRKSLYVASHATHVVGLPIDEGKALLRELIDFATQDRFVYRHKWQRGDLVIWDNLCTMHRATEFDAATYPRDMRRTTVREREAAYIPLRAPRGEGG